MLLVFIGLYLLGWMPKSQESFMDWELGPLQVEVAALSGSRSNFACALLMSNLIAESGKVVYMKVVENFIRFLAK